MLRRPLASSIVQEIWANAHETRDSISLISYASCFGFQVISAKIHSRCASPLINSKNSLKTHIFGFKIVQGHRCWHPESSSAVLVIFSKSVSICNHSRARRANSGKITISYREYPSLMPSFGGESPHPAARNLLLVYRFWWIFRYFRLRRDWTILPFWGPSTEKKLGAKNVQNLGRLRTTSIANISGTDGDIQMQNREKIVLSTAIPPAFGEKSRVNLVHYNNTVLQVDSDPPKSTFFGSLYFGPYEALRLKFLHAPRIPYAHYTRDEGLSAPTIFNIKRSKICLKFSVCAPITLRGVTSRNFST